MNSNNKELSDSVATALFNIIIANVTEQRITKSAFSVLKSFDNVAPVLGKLLRELRSSEMIGIKNEILSILIKTKKRSWWLSNLCKDVVLNDPHIEIRAKALEGLGKSALLDFVLNPYLIRSGVLKERSLELLDFAYSEHVRAISAICLSEGEELVSGKIKLLAVKKLDPSIELHKTVIDFLLVKETDKQMVSVLVEKANGEYFANKLYRLIVQRKFDDVKLQKKILKKLEAVPVVYKKALQSIMQNVSGYSLDLIYHVFKALDPIEDHYIVALGAVNTHDLDDFSRSLFIKKLDSSVTPFLLEEIAKTDPSPFCRICAIKKFDPVSERNVFYNLFLNVEEKTRVRFEIIKKMSEFPSLVLFDEFKYIDFIALEAFMSEDLDVKNFCLSVLFKNSWQKFDLRKLVDVCDFNYEHKENIVFYLDF